MSVLTVEGVTKRDGGVHALTGVDVTLPLDGRVGLIGPNGSGKTTLLVVLTGLTRATSGTIRCDGVDITSASIRRRVDLGLGRTFQHSDVFPGATVEENLRFAIDSRPRRTRAALDPAGSACYLHSVTVEAFGILNAITVVLIAVLRGAHSAWGPAMGAFLMLFIPEPLGLSPMLQQFAYGIAICVVILVLPTGVAPGIGTALRRALPDPTPDH